METLLINEQFVSPFKYWQEGKVQTGMRFRNDLFKHINAFSHRQRHQAFDLAESLVEAGKEVVITASSLQYIVWANLRASSHPPLEQPDRRIAAPTQVTVSHAPAGVLLMQVVMSA